MVLIRSCIFLYYIYLFFSFALYSLNKSIFSIMIREIFQWICHIFLGEFFKNIEFIIIKTDYPKELIPVYLWKYFFFTQKFSFVFLWKVFFIFFKQTNVTYKKNNGNHFVFNSLLILLKWMKMTWIGVTFLTEINLPVSK